MRGSKIVLFLAVLSLVGCGSDNNHNLKNDISILQIEENGLQARIDLLEKRVTQLEQPIKESTYAIFTPSSQGYSVLKSINGILYISLEKVYRYANGYKAVFDIGNPNSATFKDVGVLIAWGKDSADQNMHYSQIKLTKDVLAASWTKVILTLSPATSEETGFIKISLFPSQAYLLPDIRPDEN